MLNEESKATTATTTTAAPLFESRNPRETFADYGRAVEIQLGNATGEIFWKTGEIVRTLNGGALYEVFKDESPKEKFTVEREQLRDPQPPYNVIRVGCPACYSAADARRVDNVFQDISGVTYKYNCEACGKFIAAEPTITEPHPKPRTIHTFDQETAGAWDSLIGSMRSGKVIEIDAEVFDYFLEVLPPVMMAQRVFVGGVHRIITFGFAEGAEEVTAFWRVRDHQEQDGWRFYCQRTNIMNPYA